MRAIHPNSRATGDLVDVSGSAGLVCNRAGRRWLHCAQDRGAVRNDPEADSWRRGLMRECAPRSTHGANWADQVASTRSQLVRDGLVETFGKKLRVIKSRVQRSDLD